MSYIIPIYMAHLTWKICYTLYDMVHMGIIYDTFYYFDHNSLFISRPFFWVCQLSLALFKWLSCHFVTTVLVTSWELIKKRPKKQPNGINWKLTKVMLPQKHQACQRSSQEWIFNIQKYWQLYNFIIVAFNTDGSLTFYGLKYR